MYNIHTVFKLGYVIYSIVLKGLFFSARLHLFVQKEMHAWFKKGVHKLCFVGIECLIECKKMLGVQ